MNSRAKGKAGELELAKYLREAGYEARRGVQFKGGADSPDVQGLPGVHIECKRVEALRLYPALEQARRDAAESNVPVVVHRANRQPWVAILTLDDFLELYKQAQGSIW
jgi:Holliday junction resolvase